MFKWLFYIAPAAELYDRLIAIQPQYLIKARKKCHQLICDRANNFIRFITYITVIVIKIVHLLRMN